MSSYTPTIGLEIHAELRTRTKMFCDSKNDPSEAQPNVNVCPICMGHPGTLPVLNKAAIGHVLKVGVAVGGKLADFTEWDRKNYFYPDIPKGYQISQYKYPLVTGGSLNGFKITRIHLEEDTARSIHTKTGESLVDFNRAGIPLMELVTEPVIHSASDAAIFAKELQLALRYLGVADANMEKGEMRVEANISVGKGKKLGVKVEIKNLNSFKAVESGIAFEIERQTKELEGGGEVVQETRGWDEDKQETFSQRRKEYSHDYRYFPEPDLPKLKLSEIPEFDAGKLSSELPELPWEKRARYGKQYNLKQEQTDTLVQNIALANFFEDVVKVTGDDKEKIRISANYITSDLSGLLKGDSGSDIEAQNFAKLVEMISENKLSSRGAKDVLSRMHKGEGEPEAIAKGAGLFQRSDKSELEEIAQTVINENKSVADEYKAGKEASLQFLVGQAMKATKGSANPQLLQKIFVSLLNK